MKKPHFTLEDVKGHHGKTIAYFRSLKGWTQEELAEVMNVSTRWIQQTEYTLAIQSSERRKALSDVLDIPPDLLNLEKVSHISIGINARLDQWIIDSYERETYSRWQLYDTSSNSTTEKGLRQQIEIMEQLIDENPKEQRRLSRLLIENYQLAGSLTRDDFQYSHAKKYFRDAHHLAVEIASSDLIVTSIARLAIVLLRQERIAEALKISQEAVAQYGKATRYVQAYVESGLAEAFARNGLHIECYRALDNAMNLFERSPVVTPEEDHTHLHLDRQMLEATRGECYVLLGEPYKGLSYLIDAQKKTDPTMSRDRCRLFMQRAEAHLVAGELDYCVMYALKGLQLAKALKSEGNLNWSREIHTKLLSSKWKHEPAVGKLAKAIYGSHTVQRDL